MPKYWERESSASRFLNFDFKRRRRFDTEISFAGVAVISCHILLIISKFVSPQTLLVYLFLSLWVEASWNVLTLTQNPDFVLWRNGRVHLNRLGRQFSQLLAAEVCASAVVMLDTSCSEVVWRVLATHFIHQFPLHFPSRASPCAITFQLESTSS